MTNKVAVVERNVVDNVANRVREFEQSGDLVFPENYIPENALRSAHLVLQETLDRSKAPVLQSCSTASIANSLLSMVVQGLNPDKAQCYFIAYGKTLQLQRSYFGDMHVAKSVDPTIKDIYGKVIYEGDVLEYEIKHGKEIIKSHTQSFGDIDKTKIIGAYATVLYEDGTELSTIMTIEQIKQSWSMSSVKPVDEKGNIKEYSTHGKFTADMAEKTVIRKACKYIINSSSDKSIVAKFAKELSSDIAESETKMIIEENANTEYLDFDEETGEKFEIEDEDIQEDVIDELDEDLPEESPGY